MERFPEEYAVVGTIDPTIGATGTSTSDVVDLYDVDEVVFLLSAGVITATGGITLTVNSGTATGTVTTSVTAITALDAGDDNQQVIVSVLPAALTQGHRYVNAVLTQDTATSTASLVILAKQKYSPANEHDLASVSEIKYAG